MVWKTKNHIVKKLVLGGKREEIKFAIFPIELDDGNTVWLQSYKRIWEVKFLNCRYTRICDRYVDIGPGLREQIIEEKL